MIEAIFGLVGVVIGSFLTIAKDVFASRRLRKEEGSYSAIRLICILNEYADKCADVVQDDGTYQGQPAGRQGDVEYYYVQVTIPPPPEYPGDIAWRSLPEELMYQILWLRNKARTTDRYINATAEHAWPPDYEDLFDARQEGYAKLGFDAIDIAEQLEAKFRIRAARKAELGSDWDPKAFFGKKIAFFEERRAKAKPLFEQQNSEFPPISGSNCDH